MEAPPQIDLIVYDPIKSGGWPSGARKFASPERFLKHVETAMNAFVFIDEAKTLWDYDSTRANRLVYHRRHQGLLLFIMAQRAQMVPPHARNQCSKVFAFAQQYKDAKILEEEYGSKMFNCLNFDDGEFVCRLGNKKFEFFKLNFSTMPPTYDIKSAQAQNPQTEQDLND